MALDNSYHELIHNLDDHSSFPNQCKTYLF